MFTPEQTNQILDLIRRTYRQDEEFMELRTCRALLDRVIGAEELSNSQIERALGELVEYHFGTYLGHHRQPPDGRLVDELEELLVAIITGNFSQSTVIGVGLFVWNVVGENRIESPQFTERAWRLILRVTRRAHGNDELLQTLAVCWYEEFMRDPAYLPALLDAGLDVQSAVDVATHPGYMPREERREFCRLIAEAFTARDAREFRRRVSVSSVGES